MNLEEKVEETIRRIQNAYFECVNSGGGSYLSFSGGKDSTILAELIKMAELPTHIPFVFSDTGLELEATRDFVKNYDYDNKVTVKSSKPMSEIVKEYGLPVFSKYRSKMLNTYYRNIDDPLSIASGRILIIGLVEKAGIQGDKRSRGALPLKYFHFLHPDIEYKISNRCCEFLKKKPFSDFAKDNNLTGYYAGMRTAEGGARRLTYDRCISYVHGNIVSTPIFDWTDEQCDEFIKKYHVKISDAYTVYKMNRTGCCGCPYNKDLQSDLKILYQYEPKKYALAKHWFSRVYLDLNIKLFFDNDYMKELAQRRPIALARQEEMVEKFKNDRKI